MSSSRVTQVDRQMGQSRQLPDTHRYRALQASSAPSELCHISQLRAPGDLEFRESPSEIRDVERGNARELPAAKSKKREREPEVKHRALSL